MKIPVSESWLGFLVCADRNYPEVPMTQCSQEYLDELSLSLAMAFDAIYLMAS
jgi:hypothetical protein